MVVMGSVIFAKLMQLPQRDFMAHNVPRKLVPLANAYAFAIDPRADYNITFWYGRDRWIKFPSPGEDVIIRISRDRVTISRRDLLDNTVLPSPTTGIFCGSYDGPDMDYYRLVFSILRVVDGEIIEKNDFKIPIIHEQQGPSVVVPWHPAKSMDARAAISAKIAEEFLGEPVYLYTPLSLVRLTWPRPVNMKFAKKYDLYKLAKYQVGPWCARCKNKNDCAVYRTTPVMKVRSMVMISMEDPMIYTIIRSKKKAYLVAALCDTGAQTTVISKKLYEMLGEPEIVGETEVKPIGKSSIKVKVTKVEIYNPDYRRYEPILAVILPDEYVRTPLLLGIDFLSRLKEMKFKRVPVPRLIIPWDPHEPLPEDLTRIMKSVEW